MNVNDIFKYLNGLFPITDAMDIDNVGILVGKPQKSISKALVALDCTLETVAKAKEKDCDLIITHHPVIFEPLKNVLAGSVQYELIKNDIAVISMHTNLDVGVGGINDKLCEILELNEISPVIASDGYMLKGGVISPISAENLARRIKERIGGVVKYVDGGKEIKTVLVCSGSGGEFINEAIILNFDALLTADVKHHQFLVAKDNNISLFDGGHFNTEDIIVEVLAETLKKNFKEIEFNTFHSEIIKFA